MDPNSTLKLLREFMDHLDGQAEEGEVDCDDVGFAVEQWEALDGWLKNGGAPPLDWTKHHRVGPIEVLQRLMLQFGRAASSYYVAGNKPESVGNAIKAEAIKCALEAIAKAAREGTEPMPKPGL